MRPNRHHTGDPSVWLAERKLILGHLAKPLSQPSRINAKLVIISYRFLREATNSISSRFLREATGPPRRSSSGHHWGFFRNAVSRMAAAAKTAAMEKLPEKLPVLAARSPATAGPVIWPKPKIKVTRPKAWPALWAPT